MLVSQAIQNMHTYNTLCVDSATYSPVCFLILGLLGLPTRSGKLKDLSKFDATFFGVHAKQANKMDPQLRMLLEVTYEAIVDAGETSRNKE